jgi:hypothetical protein
VTDDDPIHLARTVIDKYGAAADKPSARLAKALLDGAHERDALRAEIERLHRTDEMDHRGVLVDKLRAEVERMRPVVHAARLWFKVHGENPGVHPDSNCRHADNQLGVFVDRYETSEAKETR